MKKFEQYADMLDMPRPKSSRKHMARIDRAAQFAPFAALTGYEEAIDETARLTSGRPELSEGEQEEINLALQHIAVHVQELPEVTVSWFCEDPRKPGGEIRTEHLHIRKFDASRRTLTAAEGETIPLDDILAIRCG